MSIKKIVNVRFFFKKNEKEKFSEKGLVAASFEHDGKVYYTEDIKKDEKKRYMTFSKDVKTDHLTKGVREDIDEGVYEEISHEIECYVNEEGDEHIYVGFDRKRIGG